jgi:uncharacterized protein DUF3800
MYICYMDEAGDLDVFPNTPSTTTPVFVLAGFILENSNITPLTFEFLDLKSKYFPNLTRNTLNLDRVLVEIKGSDIRKNVRSNSRNTRRHSLRFLNELLDLVEKYNGKIIGRVLIKQPTRRINRHSMYTKYMQNSCSYFQNYLEGNEAEGIIIADSRMKRDNAKVAHSIFTQKFRVRGDMFPNLLEMPTFSHSDNHIGIQIADLIASALIFLISSYSYCTGHILANVHVNEKFKNIKDQFANRLYNLQHRFTDNTGRFRGGITFCDDIAQRSGGEFFAL